MRINKKITTAFMVGTLVMTGVFPYVGNMADPILVQAAAGMTLSTNGGIAVMGTGDASIVIHGNAGQSLVGKSFEIYKLFYAENSKDGESVNYTFNPDYEQALKEVTAASLSMNVEEVTEYIVIDYIQSLNNNPVEGTQTEQTLEGAYSEFRYFVEELRDKMDSLNMSGDIVVANDTKSDNSIQLNGLEYGYYVIDEVTVVDDTYSASSLCMVNTSNSEADINIKSDYPSIIKKICEDDNKEDIGDDGWNDIADYEIGQTVPYKYVSDITDMNGYDAYYYAWHDVMDEALTFKKDSVKIVISDGVKDYEAAVNEFQIVENTEGDTFKISIADIKSIVDREFDDIDDNGHNVYDQTVTLTYDAILNEKAAEDTGRPGFENDVRLEFSNDPDSIGEGSTGYTPWDTVVCFTYKLNVLKENNYNKVLENAKFRLYSDSECKNEIYVKEGNNGYIVMNRDSLGGTDHTGGTVSAEAVEMVSSAEGLFMIYGLDQGTYYLKETDAPDGYRVLLDPIVITISPEYTSDRNSYVKGQGATEETLKSLAANVVMEAFFEGILHEESVALNTDTQDGSMNLTVVNQVGMKLPVTGTSALIIMFTLGAGMMICAVLTNKKKK